MFCFWRKYSIMRIYCLPTLTTCLLAFWCYKKWWYNSVYVRHVITSLLKRVSRSLCHSLSIYALYLYLRKYVFNILPFLSYRHSSKCQISTITKQNKGFYYNDHIGLYTAGDELAKPFGNFARIIFGVGLLAAGQVYIIHLVDHVIFWCYFFVILSNSRQ